MNTRITFLITATLVLLWSCDDPPAYENDDLIYNPFTIVADSISSAQDLSFGRTELDWGKHLRAVVGDTRYYKAGFTMDFNFGDSSLDISSADSIRLELRHSVTYAQDPDADSLDVPTLRFAITRVDGESIDMASASYGTLLGNQDLSVQGGDNYWNYRLPAGTIMEGDTSITLGFFPDESDYLSFVYGGGSTLGPMLSFYYHLSDTAGLDSATAPKTFQNDSVYVHLIEQPGIFDAAGTHYLSQLWNDSLVFHFDLAQLRVSGDTLQSVVSASLLPGIDTSNSAVYLMGSADSLFQMKVTDPHSELSISIQYSAGGHYVSNEIAYVLQTSLDEEQDELELILRPNHQGYDPGFLAINHAASSAFLSALRTLAVRP